MKIMKFAALIVLLVIYFATLDFNTSDAYMFKTPESNLPVVSFLPIEYVEEQVRTASSHEDAADERHSLNFDAYWHVYLDRTPNVPSVPIVTPEPVGSGLFMLGAGVLAVLRRRKKGAN